MLTRQLTTKRTRQDPSFFIHRVGRTARFGRSGASLLYLSQPEAAYVEFLAIRKVPLLEKASVADAEHAALLLTQVSALKLLVCEALSGWGGFGE